MTGKFKTRVFFYVFISLFSIYTGHHLYKTLLPEMHLPTTIDMTRAKETARAFLQTHGFEYSAYGEYAWYQYDRTGANALIDSIGPRRFFTFADTTEVPLAHWRVVYYKNVPHDKEEEVFYVFISRHGQLTGFFHQLPDSLASPHYAQSAQTIADTYLKQWPGIQSQDFHLIRNNTIAHPNRTDMEFIYERPLAGTKGVDRIRITVTGDHVSRFQRVFAEPTQSNIASVGGANLLFNTISITLYLALTILILVLFLRRYHQGAVPVRHGLWIGFILYTTMIISVFNSWDPWSYGVNLGIISRYYTKWILLGIQMVITYVYFFINSFTAWSAADYDMGSERSRWMAGMDSLLSGRFFTRQVGRELPTGLAWGAVSFGMTAAALYLLYVLDIASPLMSATVDIYNSHWPVFSMITTGIYTMLFTDVVFRKFLISYLYRLHLSPAVSVILSAFIFAMISIFINDTFKLWPAFYTLLPYFLIGLIQGWLFWRYGLLAAMASGLSFIFLMKGTFLFVTGHPFYINQLYLGAGLLSLLALAGLYAYFRGSDFHYEQQMEPEHIRRIKEQTRMQKELEIARRVQLGLLPHTEPVIEGFDLSGMCKPALEVGGDYFDFIQQPNGHMGIVIADVSGKGVPAAIYMTLTKGILQSHAESDLSPGHVLSRVNNLLYRTMERSWFVSMFYAVLDPVNKRLRYARAGHNPAIVLDAGNGQPRLLQSAGIGLGLEEGPVFQKTLTEAEISLHSGQSLIFYTDGFTEAMNRQQEEFGEKRFISFLHKHAHLPAEALIRATLEEIDRFSQGAKQHDDMTMVVLKAL